MIHHITTIGIGSPPDRDKVVAELDVGNVQFAEVNHESEIPIIEIYPGHDGVAMDLRVSRADRSDQPSAVPPRDRCRRKAGRWSDYSLPLVLREDPLASS